MSLKDEHHGESLLPRNWEDAYTTQAGVIREIVITLLPFKKRIATVNIERDKRKRIIYAVKP